MGKHVMGAANEHCLLGTLTHRIVGLGRAVVLWISELRKSMRKRSQDNLDKT